MSFFKKNLVKSPKGWFRSFATGLCQDENEEFLPWMPYSLIEYLDLNLSKNDVVFEYGFGTSTVFFANRVKKVFSIESNPKWHKAMIEKISLLRISNINSIAMFDAIDNPGYENEALDITLNLPDFKGFDWIVVDSLKRAKCCQNAIKAIKPDGKIILDDSQRLGYKKIHKFMIEKGFKCKEFKGVSPGQIKRKKAWVFYK